MIYEIKVIDFAKISIIMALKCIFLTLLKENTVLFPLKMYISTDFSSNMTVWASK